MPMGEAGGDEQEGGAEVQHHRQNARKAAWVLHRKDAKGVKYGDRFTTLRGPSESV